MTDDELMTLLHDWAVLAEFDGGYVVGRCLVCGTEELLDTWAQAA